LSPVIEKFLKLSKRRKRETSGGVSQAVYKSYVAGGVEVK